jgi:gluconolactonase
MAETLGERLNHPEGVAWDPLTGTLVAGGWAGEIYRLDPKDGAQRQIGQSEGSLLGVAVDGAGRVFACDCLRRLVLCLAPDGSVSTYSSGPIDAPFVLPNFAAFGPDGVLYVSDSGTWGQADGRLIRILPDGRAEVWSTACPGFPNGICLSADGRWLYVAESTDPKVSLIRIAEDGKAGQLETVCELSGTVPDGIALAKDGSLFVTCYRPDRIVRIRTSGEIETVVDDWQAAVFAAPTNLAFFGPTLAEAAVACLGGEWIACFDAGCRGSPLHYPLL